MKPATMAVLSLFFLLTGCGAIDTYRTYAAKNGADAADQSLETGNWLTCEGASLGSLMRRYPSMDELVAHIEKCKGEAAR